MTIVGSVNPSGDAVVPLCLRGPRGATAEIEAVIDTGFSDWVALSRSSIEALALPFREEGRYVLADGSEVTTRLFVAEADWFGRRRRILAVEMEGGPLVGMSLLRGSRLTIDVIDGGRVEIRQLDG